MLFFNGRVRAYVCFIRYCSLHMVHIFYNKYLQVCRQMLLDLQHCLTYTKPFPGGDDCEMKGGQLDLEQLSLFQGSEENQERPEYLKDDHIFKMIVMSILCITKLQTSGRFGFVVLVFLICCMKLPTKFQF
jgi:hypothetical protein